MVIAGTYSIDLFMKDKFIFPNAYMEEAENLPELKEKIYDIYFILSGDRYVIEKYIGQGNCLILYILNCTKKQTCVASFDVKASLRVPDISYLTIEMQDNNSMIKIGYNTSGVEYLKDNDQFAYNVYMERVNRGGQFSLMIHAKNVFEMQMAADGIEYLQEYEVLYIGKSKKENIFDRLNGHSTLQKIMRDTMRSSNDKELYIMIHSIGAKQFEIEDIDAANTSIVLGNTLNRTFKLDTGIDNDNMIDIAEALLISHFKPDYNDKLKKSDGLEKLATYNRIGNAEINPITFSLDLYWEESGEKMKLFTSETQTATKGRWLECRFDNGEVKISVVDLPDELY